MADRPLRGNIETKRAVINAATSGANNTIVAAPTNGKKIRVTSYAFIAAGTVTVTWKSNTTSLSGAMPFAANTGIVIPKDEDGVLETVAGEDLKVTLSAAVAITGHLTYQEI